MKKIQINNNKKIKQTEIAKMIINKNKPVYIRIQIKMTTKFKINLKQKIKPVKN